MSSEFWAAPYVTEFVVILSAGAASSFLWWFLFRKGRRLVVPNPKPWPLDDGHRHTIEGTIVHVEHPVVSPVTRQHCAGWILYGSGGEDQFWRYSASHVGPVVLNVLRTTAAGGHAVRKPSGRARTAHARQRWGSGYFAAR